MTKDRVEVVGYEVTYIDTRSKREHITISSSVDGFKSIVKNSDPLVTTQSVAGRLHERAKFYASKGGWDDTAFAFTDLAKLYEDAK